MTKEGKILIEALNEMVEYKRLLNETIHPKLNTYASLVGSGGGTSLTWLAYRKIRSAIDNGCTDACGRYELNTVRRQECMQKCKADKTGSAIAKLKAKEYEEHAKKRGVDPKYK
jgi:hypothetical protein